MLVSLKCLKQFIDLNGISKEEIAHKLTFSGIEVEEVYGIASGTNLVIGEVIDCEPHPDSDHLHVLNVNLGEKYGIKQIVCGAPNARKGIKVIVAREGAILPGGEIKHSIIRGVDSCGMCCSLAELGVDNKYLSEYQTKGIEELPDDAPIGNEDVLGYLGLDDIVFNLSVLANRPDLLSIYNVAKEIGALFNKEVKIPENNIRISFNTNLKVNSSTYRCKQFAAREIKDITIKPSPKWLSNYLMAMGIRSINNIVDIGNYVMLLTGQPLHMYDEDKLPKKELVAIDNYNGPFVALDEKSYDITSNDIVISSNNEPMCLGGVMGSLRCAVDENTKNIYIESASFDGASIRHTSNRLGLASESSSRFVKGTFHFQYEEVINLTTKLICELCDTNKVSDIVTYLNEKYEEKVINTSVNYINNRLGTSFTYDEIKEVLTRLNFFVKKVNDNEFNVIAPKFRLDVSGEADISEEVIRVLGYEHVKSELPIFDVKVGSMSIKKTRTNIIRSYLLSHGLDECLTYSLVNEKEKDLFNVINKEDKYVLLNPLTDDHKYFRTHILNSLLETATYNVNHQNKDLALFEVSEVISKKAHASHLAIVLVGNNLIQGNLRQEPYNFYHLKGLVEGIFASLGIEKSRYKFVKAANCGNEFHPGKSADIYLQNQYVGKFGEVHPTVYGRYDLGKTTCVALEINLNELFEVKVSEIKATPISKFPSVSRDLALVIDKSINSDSIIKTIKTSGKGIVSDAYIFDVYEGNNILSNKKSIAVSIIFTNNEHTLIDKEISEALDKIKFELFKAYHAELRG